MVTTLQWGDGCRPTRASRAQEVDHDLAGPQCECEQERRGRDTDEQASHCEGVITANAGWLVCTERSIDSCASNTKNVVIERLRAVSPIGRRVRRQVGRTTTSTASATIATAGSYQPR
jgi:hypothetical protein